MLSKNALELLIVLFSKNSSLQLPVGTADLVIEIRTWAEAELKNYGSEGLEKLKE